MIQIILLMIIIMMIIIILLILIIITIIIIIMIGNQWRISFAQPLVLFKLEASPSSQSVVQDWHST